MLTDYLPLSPGISAFIGSGGKTALINRCAGELAAKEKKVIVCTTTHICPFPDMPLCLTDREDALDSLLSLLPGGGGAAICVGTPAADGKLTAPSIPLEKLASLADYCLVEADGAARHPLKAHAPHEPVIPEGTGSLICVFGLGGFALPLREAVHRSGLFLDRLEQIGISPDSSDICRETDPALAAAVFEAEKTGAGTIFLNQADLPGAAKAADAFIDALRGGPYTILAGSAREGTILRRVQLPPR